MIQPFEYNATANAQPTYTYGMGSIVASSISLTAVYGIMQSKGEQ